MTDYHHVPARQDAIHLRLEQWGLWVRYRPHTWATHPMWRMSKSNAWQWHVPELKPALNPIECLEVERAVAIIPEPFRVSVRWCYASPWVPVSVIRRETRTTKEGLEELIIRGRDMVNNRLKQRAIDKRME